MLAGDKDCDFRKKLTLQAENSFVRFQAVTFSTLVFSSTLVDGTPRDVKTLQLSQSPFVAAVDKVS